MPSTGTSSGNSRLAFDRDVLGERRVDAVVVAHLQQAVAGDDRLAVAVELERTGDAVVVDVLAGGDEVAALGERRALRPVPGDAVDLAGVGDAVVPAISTASAVIMTASYASAGVVEVLEVRIDAAEAVEELRS